MKRFFLTGVGGLFLLFCAVSCAAKGLDMSGPPQAPRSGPSKSGNEPGLDPFQLGETFSYNITWKIFDAGVATMTLNDRFRYQDEEVYKITATVKSSGLMATLFPVLDFFESYLQVKDHCSRKIVKQVNEGWRHRDISVSFDPRARKAFLQDKNLNKPQEPVKQLETSIPVCVQDVISSLYVVRTMPMKVGDRFQLAINDGGNTYNVEVEVQAEEMLKTPAGNFNTLRLEPQVFGGLFKKKGRMFLWFSKDAAKVPVQIKARILVGTITATLAKIEKGPSWQAPK
jgi:hypothetical protein